MNRETGTGFDRGIFLLSLDTELAWGMVDKPVSLINNLVYFHNTRGAIDGIIELLDRYQISATWALVGSLLLDQPDFCEEFVNNVTKRLKTILKDQYLASLQQQDIWCCKDIFERIKSASTPQEIGSHGFTHLVMGAENVTRERASTEFRLGMKVVKQQGEKPVSFVFPRNTIDYLEELADAGFITYRGVEPAWYVSTCGGFRKICHILDQVFAITPPVVMPTCTANNLVDIPASMLYLSMDGFRKYIPLRSRVRKAKKGIQRAIDERKIFHLWFHPFNIASDRRMIMGLEEIFTMVDEERDRGRVQVMTMGQVAASYLLAKGN